MENKKYKAAGVLIHPEEFDRLQEREQFLSAIAEVIEDVRDGNTISDKELSHASISAMGNLNREINLVV